jgi:hypothetical protein
MRSYRICVLFAITVCTSAAQAATRVELKIDEARSNRTVAWPITTGVPFPQGALTDESHCRLLDDRGEERPLQTNVAATWDAAKSSIRWLTIDFIAQPGRNYALEFGPDVARKSFSSALTVAGETDVTVTTGPLRVEFSRGGKAPLTSISCDLDNDGKFAADERIAACPQEGDHVYRTAAEA